MYPNVDANMDMMDDDGDTVTQEIDDGHKDAADPEDEPTAEADAADPEDEPTAEATDVVEVPKDESDMAMEVPDESKIEATAKPKTVETGASQLYVAPKPKVKASPATAKAKSKPRAKSAAKKPAVKKLCDKKLKQEPVRKDPMEKKIHAVLKLNSIHKGTIGVFRSYSPTTSFIHPRCIAVRKRLSELLVAPWLQRRQRASKPGKSAMAWQSLVTSVNL